MPKRSSTNKDTQQLARKVLDSVAPDAEKTAEEKAKNPAAVALGRLGVMKGGKARARRLTSGQKIEIARKAALARWTKAKKSINP